jgi:hypothetical protein
MTVADFLSIVADIGFVVFICALIIDCIMSKVEIRRLKAELHKCYTDWAEDVRLKEALAQSVATNNVSK